MSKRILLGVSGSIAAYKVPWLVRDLQRADWQVRVVLTPTAARFVSPLVLENLTHTLVPVDSLDPRLQPAASWHVHWARWADVMIIAPVSLTTLGKLVGGIADTPVTLTALSLPAATPLGCVPAMDVEMWKHPVTRHKVATLQQWGVHFLMPEEGALASGLEGVGRLPQIEAIVAFAEQLLQQRSGVHHLSESDFQQQREQPAAHQEKSPLETLLEQPTETLEERVEQRQFETELEWTEFQRRHSVLGGKTIVITAGPTYEPIDPVRFIGNPATGTMGYALAAEAVRRGAKVILVSGPTHQVPPDGVKVVRVQTADEMHQAVLQHWDTADVFIGAAAVADFTPVESAETKLKKEGKSELILRLKRTPDILEAVGKSKRQHQVVVGFALETDDGVEAAKEKLKKKNCDFVVLNYANRPDSGFGEGKNTITIVMPERVQSYPPMSKQECAQVILNQVEQIVRQHAQEQ